MTTCITGTGLYIPPYSISNEELVESFNQYVENYNTEHAEEIAAETVTALEPSSAAFIEKGFGRNQRPTLCVRGAGMLLEQGLLDFSHQFDIALTRGCLQTFINHN